jgi:hypothetical protein
MVSTGLSTTGMISNTATISSLYDDSDTGNNTYTAHFDVTAHIIVDLEISKSVSTAHAIPGETISYSIDYLNHV